MSALELVAERPLGVRDRLAGAARTGGYLLAFVPLGIAGLLVLPMLLWRSRLPWRLATQERSLANVALRARIPQLPDAATPAARRVVLLLPLRLAAGVGAAAAALASVALTVALAFHAAEGLAGSERYLGSWSSGRSRAPC